MRNKTLIFIFIFLIIPVFIFAEKIQGYVKTENENNEKQIPLTGVSVFWINTSIGTTTDINGYFELEKTHETNVLIVAITGYENDTIQVNKNASILNILLTKGYEIEEVIINADLGGQFNSSQSIEAKQIITEAGLNKLPCCNLSESFENTATVDVTYADAVTGAKQIKMLGLAGKYSQILRENMPAVRGLSSTYGLSFIPGTWMQSVQISKGTADVINGYESATGQINIELKKPENSENLFLNLYSNSEGKFESNITSAFKLTDKVSTMFFLHGSRLDFLHDQNKDGFADMPLMSQYNFINRWKFDNNRKLDGQIGIRFLQDEKDGGQIGFIQNPDDNGSFYGIEIDTRQYEIWGKLGFLIPGTDYSSVGSTYSLSRHEQSSFFGNKSYSGIQNSFYANVIFQTIIKSTQNNLNFGGSFVYDDFDEQYNFEDYSRTEVVPGIFSQYTYIIPDKFSLIAGIRADFNNLYGVFVTPRLHAKYNINHDFVLRASAGKGFRTSNIFAENPAIFSSSRILVIEEDFKAEEAWNYGVNFTGELHLSNKKNANFSIDFYRTDFVNQLVADINTDVNEIRFYNLKGKSYSNSFQAEFSLEAIKRFDISAAFRLNDVHVTMNNELIEKPIINKYKGLLTLSYATKFNKWMVDITNQFTGTSPLPDLSENPAEFRINESSPSYYILHVQITKRFKHLDIYAGSENLSNYKQKNVIIDAENPFGEYFDASMVWGPVTGRKFFVGIRLKIKQ
ncbi:MAG: TonB-dependent receptor [Bacteroidales bacterium]|nr:TonB-dependent receptor [Bacteroidales bacterium]